jgi:alkylation response protein AidB-like acyl-CoA dehydrogenase
MDFEVRYTEDQEAFRMVFRGWLDEYAPQRVDVPPDGRPLSVEAQTQVKAFRRLLGEKGWLAPSWPIELGGAGLHPSLETIIREELGRLELPPLGDSRLWIPAMLVWGTDEQKKRYVGPALRGETITWMAFNESASGTDLASIRTEAFRDGNDYLINGSKAFITGRFDPDNLWTLVVTDHARPPHLNLGIFMIDARSPGITIKTQRLLVGSERHVFFENVRVPTDNLVGTPYLGWEIAQSVLEGERGGIAFRVNDRGTVESVIEYLKEERQQR